tara:strand:+ start:254 stop:538 length:285 start_codon:yes stop_codon:yes gene_type:complete
MSQLQNGPNCFVAEEFEDFIETLWVLCRLHKELKITNRLPKIIGEFFDDFKDYWSKQGPKGMLQIKRLYEWVDGDCTVPAFSSSSFPEKKRKKA